MAPIIRTIVGTLAVACGIVIFAGAAFMYSGLYDISASSPHWPITDWVIGTVRDRSIKVRAADISVPSGSEDPAKVLLGADHFAAHCAVCHGAPGVPKGDIAHGLYPAPPDLTRPPAPRSPAEQFWIIKHGIKLTGMPAWEDHGHDELWATVAFLQKLPTMTEAEYATLIMTNAMRGGGHQHDDGNEHEGSGHNRSE